MYLTISICFSSILHTYMRNIFNGTVNYNKLVFCNRFKALLIFIIIIILIFFSHMNVQYKHFFFAIFSILSIICFILFGSTNIYFIYNRQQKKNTYKMCKEPMEYWIKKTLKWNQITKFNDKIYFNVWKNKQINEMRKKNHIKIHSK